MSDRFTKFEDRPWVSSYVPLPLDLIAQSGAAKQEVQDKKHAEMESHLGKQWNRLAPDAENARAIKARHESIIDSFSDKDFNDPAVKHAWDLSRREITNDLSQDGAAGAQQANYNAHIEAVKKYDDLLAKGDITKQQKDYLIQKSISDYAAQGGIGKKGPTGYQSISHETAALNPDIDKQVLEQTANWKEEVRQHGGYQLGDKWITKSADQLSYIDPKEIKRAILPNIMNKPENQAYVKQQVDAAFYGRDDTSGIDSYGNPVSVRPGYLKGEMYKSFFEKPVEASAARLGFISEKHTEDIKLNPEYLYNKKKADDEASLQKQFRFTTGIKPSSPEEGLKVSDSAINKTLSESTGTDGAKVADSWKMVDNKLVLKTFKDNKYAFIGKDKLPLDEIRATHPELTESIDGYFVNPKTGEKFPVKSENTSLKDQYKSIYMMAKRLGVDVTKDTPLSTVKSAVENYLLKTNDLNMNYTRFDEGSLNALNSMVNATVNKDGIINNVGNAGVVTIKNLAGDVITPEQNAAGVNASIMSGGRFIGSAKSLTNENYKPGDMFFEGKDPEDPNNVKTYIVNINNQTFNDALSYSDHLSKSIHRYIDTGKKSISDEEVADIVKQNPGLPKAISKNIVGHVQSKSGEDYYTYLYNGKIKTMKVDNNGTANLDVPLSEANTEIDQSYTAPIMSSFNKKNFDRSTKAEDYSAPDEYTPGSDFNLE